jgi:hypothetical protein
MHKPNREPDIQQEFVSPENQIFALHESEGFEPNDFATVREFLLHRSRQELPLSERIHGIWYVNFFCNLMRPRSHHQALDRDTHGWRSRI